MFNLLKNNKVLKWGSIGKSRIMKWLMVFMIGGLAGIAQTTVFCADIIVNSATKINLPAVGTAGRLYRVTDDMRGLWMDSGSQWFGLSGEVINVKEFGAKGDGSTDDRAAIQAALDIADSRIIFFPPGTYEVRGPLDGTSHHRITLQGTGKYSGTTIRGRFSGANVGKPVLDMTGASNWTFRDIAITGIGTAPDLPGCAVLLARSTDYNNSGGHEFNSVALGGSTTKAVLGMLSSEDNRFFNTDIGTDQVGTRVLYTSSRNTLGLTSAFRTISLSSNSDVIAYFGGSISSGTGSYTQTVELIWIDEAYDARFYGTFINSSSNNPVNPTDLIRLSGIGVNHNIVFDGVHVEGSTDNMIHQTSSGTVGLFLRGINHRTSQQNPGVGAIVKGDAGTSISFLFMSDMDAGIVDMFAVDVPTLNYSFINAGKHKIRVTNGYTDNFITNAGTMTLPAGTIGSPRQVGQRFFLGGDTASAAVGFKQARGNQLDLSFGNIAANSVVTRTVSVPGVTLDNTWIVIATPMNTLEAGLVWSAYVTAADTVTVRVANPTTSAINTAANQGWVIVALQI